MSLTREQIEAADDLPREEVPVPEWNGSVFIRLMTAGEHARLGVDFEAIPRDELMAYVLAKTLCDEAGRPLFDEGGVAVLSRKNKDVILRLYGVASRLNKMAAGDVEDAAKN